MLLEDIADYLATVSGMGTVGTDIFASFIPETPDSCICIYEYAGQTRERTFDGSVVEHPGLQVVARGTNYPDARSKIESVVNALDGVADKTINSVRYISILANQAPVPLGRDENNRVKISVNFTVAKEVG